MRSALPACLRNAGRPQATEARDGHGTGGNSESRYVGYSTAIWDPSTGVQVGFGSCSGSAFISRREDGPILDGWPETLEDSGTYSSTAHSALGCICLAQPVFPSPCGERRFHLRDQMAMSCPLPECRGWSENQGSRIVERDGRDYFLRQVTEDGGWRLTGSDYAKTCCKNSLHRLNSFPDRNSTQFAPGR
jgi:hypothetical protein